MLAAFAGDLPHRALDHLRCCAAVPLRPVPQPARRPPPHPPLRAGIVLAFGSGAAAILTRDEDLEPKLAVPVRRGDGPDAGRVRAAARARRRVLAPRGPAERADHARRHRPAARRWPSRCGSAPGRGDRARARRHAATGRCFGRAMESGRTAVRGPQSPAPDPPAPAPRPEAPRRTPGPRRPGAARGLEQRPGPAAARSPTPGGQSRLASWWSRASAAACSTG